jgi:hypothetical protein
VHSRNKERGVLYPVSGATAAAAAPAPPSFSDLMSFSRSMATTGGHLPDPPGKGAHYISNLKDQKFRIRPPNDPSDNDSPSDSIVLDVKAYLDERINSSTATGYTADNNLIQVTFWIAHPPRVSYFTVHFPKLPTSALAELPRIICTDGNLVLLRVAIGPRHLLGLPKYNCYIIYRAGSSELEVLPSHPTRLFADQEVGLLCCHSTDHRFFVAALHSAFRRGHYMLDLFDSKTGSWITKTMYVESWQEHNYSFSCPTKVITIGGKHGSVAWVDLCQGILICDVLRGDETLRYIGLPLLLAPNKMPRGASCDRDIAISNGTIKYFEMCVHAQAGSRVGSTYISEDWVAASWKWMDSEKNWHMDCNFKASEVLVDKSCYQLLPKLSHHDEDAKMIPTLSRLHTGHPALSLHEDDVVYIMAKVEHRDHKAWMLAVDMRNKTLKVVANFNAERTSSFRFTYLQSKISKYMPRRLSKR